MQFLKSGSILSALTLLAVQASAQETTAPEAASADVAPAAVGASGLEEVVVSATKRQESLQRVPVSVNAIPGSQLQQEGIVRLQDMQLPSLTVQEGGIGNSVFIRGIGSGINPGFEQSAGTYVDGIYRGRGQLSRAPLFDVERIELLRGPQTTLFGKNSVAGAINVTSAAPTSTLDGYVTALYDFDLEETQFEGAISGPLGDRVRGRLSGRATQADGFVENLTSGKNEPRRDDTSVRGQLAFDVTDNLTATLKAEVSEFNKEGRGIEIYNERPAAAGPFTGLTYAQILRALGSDPSVLNNTLDYKRSGGPEKSDNRSEEYALTLDWAIGEHTLTAITGYSTYNFNELCDCDFTGANVFNVGLDEDFNQFSQEIRFASSQGNKLDYIVGAYYENTDLEYRDSILINQTSILVPLINAMAPGGGTAIANTATPRVFTQDESGSSAFARLTWNATDDLHLNFGVRAAYEEKDASRTLTITGIDGTPLAGAAAVVAPAVYAQVFNVRAHSLSGSRDGWKTMPSFSVQYDLSNDVMGYLSYVQGYKSGGFDARSNNPTAPPATVCTAPNTPAGCIPAASVGSFEFKDENSQSYEAGLKSRFAHDRAELNLAYYYNDFKDLQVSTFDGVLGFNVSNAGAATVQGVELDGRWQIVNSLLLRGSLAWTDFEYKEFFGQCYVGQAPNAPDGRNCDYAGKTNMFVPDLAGSVALDWSINLGSALRLATTLETVYSGSYFPQATLDPATEQDSYFKYNARIALMSQKNTWEIALLGRNLTDETVTGYAADIPLAARTFGAPSYGSFVAPPRSIALQARWNF
ncbi:MAG TPA: TonB-dependent receptor [Steroidobacteraceae bacterium]|nr:TonB-dependent receptor [Steroidobacteraceae bacterium]